MVGSILKRGKDSYRLTYDVARDASGRRQRRTVTVRGTRKDAEKRLTELLSQRDQGFDVEPNRLTVAEFLAKWIDTHPVSPPSKVRYGQLIRRHILEQLGPIRLSSLKPLQIQSRLAEVEATVSASTACDVLMVMNMALSQAVRWQLIARNPAQAVERPRAEETDTMRVLVPAEIDRLVAAAAGTEFELVVTLALATGTRRGEALALKWPAVDLVAGTITIAESARYVPGEGVVYGTPKTKKSRRVIVLAADVAELLREHRRRQAALQDQWLGAWGNADHLVCTNEIGEPIPIGSFNARFSRIAARAGLDGLRFHDLRHTHGTLLAGAGVNPKVISDRLGHSDVKFTLNRYVTPTEDHQRAAAEAFSAIVRLAR